jgi:hypothetical protein
MILERSKRKAVELLASLPANQPDAELSIASVEDQEVWLGIGWLVGNGWAVYRGDYCFRLSKVGRAEAPEFLADAIHQ